MDENYKYNFNLFREILANLPSPNIEIISDKPEDKKISEQLTNIVKWKIVESRNDMKSL
jgi:hypothetical protein